MGTLQCVHCAPGFTARRCSATWELVWPTATIPVDAHAVGRMAQRRGASINALVIARDNIVFGAVQGDIAGTRAACQTAAGALATLQKHLPSPNLGLTNVLQQAINDYHVGIRHCISGTQNQDAVEIGEATVYIKQGYTDLQKAVHILEDDLSADSDVLTV